ncbi:MAG: divergent PAP2 family protein [Clostridia bacterium]|nr:divergent PAP2 family protein [Clostridia bacterium]
MYTFKALFTNYWLLSAMSGWLLAQLLKIFTGFFKLQSFSIRALLFGTGGMPSSHTAAVTGLCTACAVTHGFGSPLFAITALFCIVIMIDATGVRRETGMQSRALNQIIEELFSNNGNFDRQFKELIGHTPLQVFFGAVTGVGAALLLSLIPGLR